MCDKHSQNKTSSFQLEFGRMLEWERSRIFDKDVASVFLDIVKKAKTAEVISVNKKEKSKQRPIALNTVELLRIASAKLGIGPQQTMHVAEKLYIQVCYYLTLLRFIFRLLLREFRCSWNNYKLFDNPKRKVFGWGCFSLYTSMFCF